MKLLTWGNVFKNTNDTVPLTLTLRFGGVVVEVLFTFCDAELTHISDEQVFFVVTVEPSDKRERGGGIREQLRGTLSTVPGPHAPNAGVSQSTQGEFEVQIELYNPPLTPSVCNL